MDRSYPRTEKDEHTCDPTRRSYDTVAADYDAALAGELAAKPLDRALVSLLADDGAGGAIADRARIDRCPYPEEHPSSRTYLLLHKI